MDMAINATRQNVFAAGVNCLGTAIKLLANLDDFTAENAYVGFEDVGGGRYGTTFND